MEPTRSLTSPSTGTTATARAYRGEVVYLYAFDIAYEMRREPVSSLLGHPVAEFALDTSKRNPRQHMFYRPRMVRPAAIERVAAHGAMRLERTIKLLPVGAISITIRAAFEVQSLEELVSYHNLRFVDGTSLHDEVLRLADDVRYELGPLLVRPLRNLADEEAYTVFWIKGPLADQAGGPVCCEDWLDQNRRSVAALLAEEPSPVALSAQEVEESTSKAVSYYQGDLVVADWDAALVIDEPHYFEATLHVMEMANLQLAELEAYDRMLDEAVERSYRDVARRRWRSLKLVTIPPDLRELRVDLARLSDELANTTKFFGDWFLARTYQTMATRFHLSDWHRQIDDKLKTIDDLYQLLRGEQTNRWMLVLEASIVILFIVDLLMLALGSH